MLPQQELTNSGLNRPDVSHFFHEGSSTLTYVVTCTDTGHCAIIDPVLDFDYASGSLTTTSADALIEHIRSRALTVDLILETHVHADHLTAPPPTMTMSNCFSAAIEFSPQLIIHAAWRRQAFGISPSLPAFPLRRHGRQPNARRTAIPLRPNSHGVSPAWGRQQRR